MDKSTFFSTVNNSIPSFKSFLINEARKIKKNNREVYKIGNTIVIINPTGDEITQKYV